MGKGTKEIHTSDFDMQVRDAHIAIEGDAAIDVDPRDEYDIDVTADMGKAERLAFAEEQMIINISPSAERFPEDPVMVSVNGRACYIPRGRKCVVRRKYVERLARAVVDTIRQDLSTEALNPTKVNTLTISPSLKYPFSVIHDPNPRGPQWLQKLMAEA